MVQLMDPKKGERLNDPAAGTFGFMIAADHYLKEKYDDFFDLSPEEVEFQKKEALSGMELVPNTHKLALMNALLHDIEGRLDQGDSLSANGKWMKDLHHYQTRHYPEQRPQHVLYHQFLKNYR